jgi:tRNA(fMet)-specific endonuclease VapC
LTPGADPTVPIVLDTSAYSRLRTGDPQILSLLAHAPHAYLPVIAIGELEAAFARGSKRSQNRALLEEFIAEPFVHVVDVDRATADRYGELVKALLDAGTPMPTNDVWMAATAAGTDGQLVTFDRDFLRVPGLRCVVMA